jgi:hypothetical protein
VDPQRLHAKVIFNRRLYAHGQGRMFRATGSFYNGLSDFEGDVALSFSKIADTKRRLRFTISQKKKPLSLHYSN